MVPRPAGLIFWSDSNLVVSHVDQSPPTTSETLIRTIQCPAESSSRKNRSVEAAIEEFQSAANYIAEVLPSMPEQKWSYMNSHLYRMVREEFDDTEVNVTIWQAGIRHAVGKFLSWKESGTSTNYPTLGEGSFFSLPASECDLVENNRGFGIRAKYISYEPEWFHLNIGSYQTQFLERVVEPDDSARLGAPEFHLDDDSLSIHLPIQEEVEVYEPEEVDTRVGVDLGEQVIFAAAVVDETGVQSVEMEPGREFQHHRRRFELKEKQLQSKGDLRRIKKCWGERERYTKQIMHNASRQIVDLAASHEPAAIHLEDLSNYQQTVDEPIHDWPYGMLQKQIVYKAQEAGIPVKIVDPAYTSITCRKCGQSTPEFRDGTDFECRRCGYEVHADVNAAINIAKKCAE